MAAHDRMPGLRCTPAFGASGSAADTALRAFRCNKNFNDDVVRALCEGIQLKKELRVSTFFSFYLKFLFLLYRPSIWVKMIFPTLEFSYLEKH